MANPPETPLNTTDTAADSAPRAISANLRKLCAQFAKPQAGRAAWQLVNTLVPLGVDAAAAQLSQRQGRQGRRGLQVV